MVMMMTITLMMLMQVLFTLGWLLIMCSAVPIMKVGLGLVSLGGYKDR